MPALKPQDLTQQNPKKLGRVVFPDIMLFSYLSWYACKVYRCRNYMKLHEITILPRLLSLTVALNCGCGVLQLLRRGCMRADFWNIIWSDWPCNYLSYQLELAWWEVFGPRICRTARHELEERLFLVEELRLKHSLFSIYVQKRRLHDWITLSSWNQWPKKRQFTNLNHLKLKFLSTVMSVSIPQTWTVVFSNSPVIWCIGQSESSGWLFGQAMTKNKISFQHSGRLIWRDFFGWKFFDTIWGLELRRKAVGKIMTLSCGKVMGIRRVRKETQRWNVVCGLTAWKIPTHSMVQSRP